MIKKKAFRIFINVKEETTREYLVEAKTLKTAIQIIKDENPEPDEESVDSEEIDYENVNYEKVVRAYDNDGTGGRTLNIVTMKEAGYKYLGQLVGNKHLLKDTETGEVSSWIEAEEDELRSYGIVFGDKYLHYKQNIKETGVRI